MNKSKPPDHTRLIDASASNHTAKLTNKFKSKCNMLSKLMSFASSVPDFRRPNKGNIRHKLKDIITLMILGRSCGHAGRADIIEFSRHDLNKFKKMGLLGNCVTSEATLCRVENGIDSQAMADGMRQFAENFHENLLKDSRGMKISASTARRSGGQFWITIIADKEKWGAKLTVIRYDSDTIRKSTGNARRKHGCM